ncbi:MAG: hypothetical protein GXX94_00325 [Chloroflexi bacterium]|nr:hypothetical protein [Chloroflexota bacterium]
MPAFDLLRAPDHVTAFERDDPIALSSEGAAFSGHGIALHTVLESDRLRVALRASRPVSRLRLRWNDVVPEGLRYLCDAWPGNGSDLEWRALAPDRVMPWSFLAYDGQHTHGIGVRTGASALCHWQLDPYGANLWLDVRSGTEPLEPEDREIALAEVVVRMGRVWEVPFEAARRFVSLLNRDGITPGQVIYGFALDLSRSGEWTQAQALQQASLLADLAENTVNRPVCVVGRGLPERSGLQDADLHAGSAYGDLAALAAGIAERGCRPGLWLHPLLTDDPSLAPLCLAPERSAAAGGGHVLDPTQPEAIERIGDLVAQARARGFEFIRYGDMIPEILHGTGRGAVGVRFANPRRTTAETLSELYRTIRAASGPDTIIAGAGTCSHLASGHVHLQRLAPNISYERWEDTRGGALGALAFRGFQHGILYAAETSPVRLDTSIPWSLNEQWLRLQSNSGISFFVVPGRGTPAEAQQSALRSAFGNASRPLQLAEPLDWLVNACPVRWKMGNDLVTFDWFSAGYAS